MSVLLIISFHLTCQLEKAAFTFIYIQQQVARFSSQKPPILTVPNLHPLLAHTIAGRQNEFPESSFLIKFLILTSHTDSSCRTFCAA